MKNQFKLAIVIILLFNIGWVYGQTTAIDYILESETIETSGMDIAILSTISKIGNSIEWKQEANNNVDVTNFQISAVSGDWNQSTSTGVLIYTIVIEDYQGLFVLEGTVTGLTASLSLSKNGVAQQLYIFKTNNITYL